MRFIRSFIFSKIVLSILVVACLLVTGLDLYIQNSQDKIVGVAALNVAKNEVYSILQLSKAYQQGQETEQDELDLIKRFNQNLNQKSTGLTVEAVTADSLKTDFQKKAYQALIQNPEQPYFWLEKSDMEPIFHYAIHLDITKEPHKTHTILQLNIPMGEFQKIQDAESKKTLWVLSLFGVGASLVLAVLVGYTRFSTEVLAESQKNDLEYQKKLASAYERFFPREFLNLLGKKNILEIQLGDHSEKVMTVLFADIRNFTAVIEKKTTAESFKFINDYLAKTGPIIRQNSGFIDKYIGDAIMALFSKPEDALNASIKMLSLLRQESLMPESSSGKATEIGIGLHSGPLMVGTVGEAERMDGTVISDVVNTASRLEGLNKIYGTSLLITDAFINNLESKMKFKIRFIDHVYLKGKIDAIKVYEVFDVDPPDIIKLKEQIRDDFQMAVDCYQKRQFNEALALLQKCQAVFPQDLSVQIYIKRCNTCLSETPKEGWDPIERLT